MNTFILTLIAGLIMTVVGSADASSLAEAVANENGGPRRQQLQIRLANWSSDDLTEQDVYVEREPGSGEVWRVTRADHDWAAPLYRPADARDHHRYSGESIGPFPKGSYLGLTLGEYFAAEGTGTYTCSKGRATIMLSFERLVPHGVYSIWHSFMATPPTQPESDSLHLPLGARDGSDATFIADEKGYAQYHSLFSPCLQLSGEHLAGMLSVTWHSDGRSHGVKPGQFATASHIQLWTLLPRRSGLNLPEPQP